MHKRVLQRLTESLRRQDWIGVAVEFVIVVLGVYVGIQASNWNQERRDRAEERRYYAQIIGDLRADLITLDNAIRYSRRYDAAAEHVLRAVEHDLDANESPGRLARNVTVGGYAFLPKSASRTIDELISTGGVGLLRNQPAKAGIASYYQAFEESRQWDGLIRQQQSEYWHATAGVVPREVLQATMQGREAQISKGEAETILRRIRARPAISDLLVNMAAHQEGVRRDSVEMQRRARRLIQLLEPLASE